VKEKKAGKKIQAGFPRFYPEDLQIPRNGIKP
jgi:hypothetical protein